MPKKKTHEAFICEMQKKRTDIQVLGTYLNSYTPVEVKCLVCNNIWKVTPHLLLRGSGCPECARLKQRKTHEEFVKELKEISPNIKILGRYIDSRTPIEVECKVCGHIWSTAANNLVHGTNCVKCRRKQQRKIHETFVKEMKERMPEITVLGTYESRNKKVTVRCEVCGHIWDANAHNLLKKEGCPKCGLIKRCEKRRTPFDVILQKVSEKNPEICILGEYVNSKTNILAKCLVCGYEWETSPNTLMNGKGCPRCVRGGTSFTEQFILWAFRHVLGEETVKSRDKSAIGVELDIYIPKLKFAVEPGSWHWHKNRLDSDKNKELLCEKNGIQLVFIYDSCPKDFKTSDNHFAFYEYIVNPPEYSQLKTVVKSLFERAGITYSFSDDDWLYVEAMAYKFSKAMSMEEFAERLAVINQNIEIVGNKFNYSMKIPVKCRVCGYMWDAIPKSLLDGRGCPSCAGVAHKTHEEFVKQMEEINPLLTIRGEYLNSHSKIEVECKTCSYTWPAAVHSLLQGHGCPACAGLLRKDTERFKEELAKIMPTILVIGEYKNNKTPITVQCKICKNIWSSVPKDLLNGHGCIICAGKKKKTTDEFIEELKRLFPEIIVLGEYVRNSIPIEVKCKKCDYVWSSSPSTLLNGKGCPRCNDRHKTTRKKDVIVEWRKANPNGTQKMCREETGISLTTIGKWWYE